MDSWSYLFTHYTKVDALGQRVSEAFPTFVHHSIVYKRQGKKISKEERPTLGGLLFVQGDPDDIQEYLRKNFYGIYLVKDPATEQQARISDQEMRTFMRIADVGERTIRFMLHPIDDYSKGHARIRITSGILTGMEGYIVRVARDRCLVTQIGNLTIAIGGVHADSFENVEQYSAQRGVLDPANPADALALKSSPHSPLTP